MAFATTDDVATRLGRALTGAEAAMAEQVIESVTAQIADAVNHDLTWAEDLDPVPGVLKTLCVEKVIVVGSNPSGLAAENESLGAYSHGRTFQRSNDVGVWLTAAEQRMARLAVHGRLSTSVRQSSHVDTVIDLLEDGEIGS